ncbi:MAG: UxaA family hydrolase [Anaerovoracaceae bacterium]
MSRWIRIQAQDNVAVALCPLQAGEHIEIPPLQLTLQEDIPQGHKFALTNIPMGASVMKYGAPIGTAQKEIPAGTHVHSHNTKTALHETGDYTYHPSETFSPDFSDFTEKMRQTCFQGYLRKDGSVGIRNELWIIPTVGCVNSVGQKIAALAKSRNEWMEGIDDIVAFQHPYGCSQLGGDQDNTRKILADLCMHPNAGGVLLLGLGCENSGVEEIKKYIRGYDPDRIQCLVCQEVTDEITAGLELLHTLAETASNAKRSPFPLSCLTVGVKCGGSDGLSGITANPLVGHFTDWLTQAGGSILMSEVPEMFGAEEHLLNRCESREVFDKAVRMIQGFKSYFSRHGQPVYENPSPGNKAGGITTLEDKSLGCTQKSGHAPVVDVLEYAEQKKTNGLSLVTAPGNDLVSSTALAAAGAQLILFTTGRGTPFASPVPTIKISSNSQLQEKKNNWIDFNAGCLTETADFEPLTDQLCACVLAVANGLQVKSERAGYHDMAIFKQNITL